MAFCLKDSESVAKGIKRIVRRQVDNALRDLEGGPASDEAVHEARRRCKKIRAVLRLVRDALGNKVYRHENACFRDAGRTVTEVRDAKMLLDTLDAFVEESAGRRGGDLSRMREVLSARQREVNKRLLEDQKAFAHMKSSLARARSRLPQWTLTHSGWSAIRDGLKRTYKQCRSSLARAAAEPTPENLHECRKQAKYLWHQLQVLESMKAAFVKELGGGVHKLTQLLGKDHDLFMLRQAAVRDHNAFFEDSSMLEKLRPLIDGRRKDLQQKAFKLGRTLFAEKPGAFVKQVREYWETWRSQAKVVARK
jgi:CHAD domain-containing protein